MNSVVISMVVIPGVVSLLLFLVFTYLYEQSRQAYFRAWQLAWAAYSCTMFSMPSLSTVRLRRLAFLASSLFLGGDGFVHLCVDAPDARAFPLSLV